MIQSKQLTKTLLISSLALLSAYGQAGELSVSGSSDVNFAGDTANTGNTGLDDSSHITVTASGELDNGMAVSYVPDIDTVEDKDVTGFTLNMGDMGTITFDNQDAGLTGAIKVGISPAFDGDGVTSDATGLDTEEYVSGNLSYGLADGLAVSFSYTVDGDIHTSGSINATYAYDTDVGKIGLGVKVGDSNINAVDHKKDETSYVVAYAYGPVTVGFQTGDFKAQNAADTDAEYTALGVSFAVSDDLRVSYGRETDDLNNSITDQEIEAYGISYAMGGMTISATHYDVDNVAGTNDENADALAISIQMAF